MDALLGEIKNKQKMPKNTMKEPFIKHIRLEIDSKENPKLDQILKNQNDFRV